MKVFSSLEAALKAGFHAWDVTKDGMTLVRIMTPRGYALALAKGN
jgi:hypothetical protein